MWALTQQVLFLDYAALDIPWVPETFLARTAREKNLWYPGYTGHK